MNSSNKYVFCAHCNDNVSVSTLRRHIASINARNQDSQIRTSESDSSSEIEFDSDCSEELQRQHGHEHEGSFASATHIHENQG